MQTYTIKIEIVEEESAAGSEHFEAAVRANGPLEILTALEKGIRTLSPALSEVADPSE